MHGTHNFDRLLNEKDVAKPKYGVAAKTTKEKRRVAKKAKSNKINLAADKKKAVAKTKAAAKAEKAKDTATLRKLKSLGDEINHRLKKADENTVAIELQMADAKKICKANKIVWKDWVAENLDYSLSQINKLCFIGAKENPEQAKLASQAKEATRQRKRRAKAKATARTYEQSDSATVPAKSEFTAACEYLARLNPKLREQIINATAGKMDLVIVSKVDPRFTSPAEAKIKVGPPTAKSLMVGFLAMKAQEKVMFVKQCGDHIGFTVTDPFEGSRADGDTDGIPASMQRDAKGKGTVADQAKA